MAFAMFERVRETTTTTGTGALALAAAYADHRRFRDVYAVNDTMFYFINHSGSNSWEAGWGTYSATDTLTRTQVIESTNGNLAVNFAAGTKDVWVAWPASTAKNLINQTHRWVVSGGTGTIYTLDYSPPVPAYFDGLMLYWRAHTNSVQGISPDMWVSANVNSLGARQLVQLGGLNPIQSNTIFANTELCMRYNAAFSRFEMLGP